MAWQTRIPLRKAFFGEREQVLAEHDDLRASGFLFGSGVQGLRLENPFGHLTLLPFQGQQIWHLEFNGRTLTMRSMFVEPRATNEFLNTYGGFLVHCGATAMGTPSKEDTHPPHGELPNAPYQEATLLVGEDSGGRYMALTGSYQHTVAFNHNYRAQPLVKLYAASTQLQVSMTIDNLKKTEMELMYLAHANFRPVDQGLLIYSAKATPQTVRVRRSIPSHIKPKEGYQAFIETLAHQPEKHHRLAPDLDFDPEVVFFVDYLADSMGWSHSMQVHPDGSADYIAHRPEQLGHGIRWISRTPDQDCLGIVLPATAESEGYLAEKVKGHLRLIPAGGQFYCELRMGRLNPDETQQIAQKIASIIEPLGFT